MFTQQHFEGIADVLREQRPGVVGDSNWQVRAQWAKTVRAMADFLATKNPRFDRVKFLKQAGITFPDGRWHLLP